MHIGFITAADLSRYFPALSEPLLTHDDYAAGVALAAAGHTVTPVVWGTDLPQLSAYDLLIVRSPWDYMDTDEKRSGLFHWLSAVASAGIPLQNHIDWLLWNSDKNYLGQLAALGVPVVPTRYLGPDEHVDNAALARLFRDQGPFVLKPTVSAAARDTFLIDQPAVAACLHSLNGRVEGDFSGWRGMRMFMIQPFLPEIRTHGEWSLVYFGGEFSHAVHKQPASGQWLVQDELGGSVLSAQPPLEVAAVARQAAAVLPQIRRPMPLYMRIDVIQAAAGPLVSEIEMIEPELFFLSRLKGGRTAVNDDAVRRFAEALGACNVSR
jgi:glutathione synthase/RimK-type ligase-like ATP-grasp enzyme